eukprot:TRINITY_DN11641_c0_g1_i1.p1 TRINITY_DN11641_c0_g1~~TRINITY_DN11641_c0_g1_i1.p1  ORF type:complete len:298 (+),score=35.21 TRINITY_DN11641_c0_g1_i1:27-896(+)
MEQYSHHGMGHHHHHHQQHHHHPPRPPTPRERLEETIASEIIQQHQQLQRIQGEQYMSPSRGSEGAGGNTSSAGKASRSVSPVNGMMTHLQEVNMQLTEAVRLGQVAQAQSAAKISELQGLLQESMKRNEEYGSALRNREEHIKELEQIIRQKDAELRDKDRHLTSQSVELMELRNNPPADPYYPQHSSSQQQTFTTPTHGGIFRKPDDDSFDRGGSKPAVVNTVPQRTSSPVRDRHYTGHTHTLIHQSQPGTPRSTYGNRLQELVLKRKQEAAMSSAASSRGGSGGRY